MRRPSPAALRGGVLGAVALALALAACQPSSSPQQAASPQAAPLEGRKILGNKGCLSCHAVTGQGGTLGPELGLKTARKGVDWIHDYLTSGQHIDVYPGNSHAAFRSLSAAEARELATFLASLSTPGAYQ